MVEKECNSTPATEAQGTLSCPSGLHGVNGATVAAAAATGAGGSENVPAITSLMTARVIVYRLSLVKFHRAEKNQFLDLPIWKELFQVQVQVIVHCIGNLVLNLKR